LRNALGRSDNPTTPSVHLGKTTERQQHGHADNRRAGPRLRTQPPRCTTMYDDLAWMDGVGQAALERQREVASVELVEAALRRMERLNPQLHAVAGLLADEALAVA